MIATTPDLQPRSSPVLDLAQPLLPCLELTFASAPTRGKPRRQAKSAPKAPEAPGAAAPAAAPLTCDAAELRAARRVYLALATRWDLTGHEALVLLGEPLGGEAERRERLRVLMGVNRLLQLMEPGRSPEFLRQPQAAFDGAAPLQLMLAGGCAGIVQVRDYLVERARW